MAGAGVRAVAVEGRTEAATMVGGGAGSGKGVAATGTDAGRPLPFSPSGFDALFARCSPFFWFGGALVR
ncbi:MAG TPA: hypothetical protein DDZ81_16415 [Acetobacteraceae bacterium]|nr:hypothetical protein [Acetobacteraceae bacterium]